ncbi:MAG TPA: proton-conducting transporter membrane subunit [Aggregatilineales bacterium]|nr:DUF4040 domain-containing protein [Anaerolineales bacterium]HRE46675.1 proton-conducting transporter membrane subunit [Aggregatilineales bacterium]
MTSLVLAVFAPVLGALALTGFDLIVPKTTARKKPWLVGWVVLIPALAFVYFLSLVGGDPLSAEWAWVARMGVTLSFYADGLALLFALIISGVGALILIYAGGYFHEIGDYTRFCTLTLLFMTAMLGVVLSGNLLQLFMFWELTSVTSFLLIGFKHEKKHARDGAKQALLITGAGGLSLLAGVLLIGIAAGTFDVRTLLSNPGVIRESSHYLLILTLVALGAFAKSAQFPLHFWLPGAMEAPTPASAYLHSATMVKAGVFLLARLGVVLNGTTAWQVLITSVGLITFLYGVVIALRQRDMKAILAYSTVSWLGILVALQGAGTKDGAKALVVGLLAHALYKSALFLVAGSVDHATGTRDMDKLAAIGGLARPMPFTAAAAVIGALGMAGIPPLLGFLGKETLKVAALSESFVPPLQVLWVVVAVVGSAFHVGVAGRIAYDTFVGRRSTPPPPQPHGDDHPAGHGEAKHPHEAPIPMLVGALTPGILSLALPLAFLPALSPLLTRAVSAIYGKPTAVDLQLYEGINLPLILSMIAIGLGAAIFSLRQRIFITLRLLPEFNPVGVYKWLFFTALPNTARAVTYRVQPSLIREGIVTAVLVMVGTVLVMLTLGWDAGSLDRIREVALRGFEPELAIICALIIIDTIGILFAPTRLAAIIVMGLGGAMISLIFAIFGAPDLAFTNLMVDVISLALFILAFHFLPDVFMFKPSRSRQFRDALVAGAFGLTVTLLILVAHANALAPSIASYYIKNAYPFGQGKNIVNVIIVDFRGLDTLGEITVLLIAGIGVTALLRFRPSRQGRGVHLDELEPVPVAEEFHFSLPTPSESQT